jgi:predicted ribosomally synthesized peptide with SipW-like signal peptide
MSKKKVLSLSLVVIMIAILSLSSLAWFNDTDSVKNEFYIATSDDPSDPDDIFSVDIWEPVDKNGDGVISDDEKEQTGLKFENILPGSSFDKEPTVENTGAYDQYIRVVVTLSDAKAWMKILGPGYDLSTIFVGHDEDLWTRSGNSGVKGEDLVYVYYLDKVLKPDETVALFTDVKLPTSLTQQEMAELNGGFELTIRADAIQTENLGDGVDTAQEAFAAANWGNYVNTAPVS